MLAEHCGRMPQSNSSALVISSTGNQMLITFNTDSSDTYRGFKLVYPPRLNITEFTEPRGEITSPNYPMSYPSIAFKEWKIVAPQGYIIELRFEDLQIEDCFLCECDAVEIFDGESGPPIERVCGYRRWPLIYPSETNILRLRFTSDGNVNESGFRATYKFVESLI